VDAAVRPIDRTSGWQAGLRLGFRARSDRTVLAERRRFGPLAVQRPFYPEGNVCHVYLLHPPGGIVGGDRLDIEVTVDPGAHALVTTPGAAKFYRSAGPGAVQKQRIAIGDGGTLEWLPQENIFFPGARARLDTRIELQGGARFAYWEIQCLGRPVIDEGFDSGMIDSRLAVLRDQRPLVLERLRVTADNRSRLSLMAGLPVGGTLLVSDAGEAEVEACRDLLLSDGANYTGVTLLDDILVVRYLGESTEQARRLFSAVWREVRPTTLGRAASAPRIWAT
jgi:urease accessory protein